MNSKKQARLRRARRSRAKISELGIERLCINRTPRHIYAQVISVSGDKVIVSASTLEKGLSTTVTGNSEAAKEIGKLIADRAKAIGVLNVAFDRSGFKYHGRVKALADAARDAGLNF